MKKEDFYNTNKDMNNLTTMLIDLLLKRLLEERYSEFYTESLSESKRYYPVSYTHLTLPTNSLV